MSRTIHIIGAGLAGLSAALKLSGRGEAVIVHEATAFAGGRCRSYHDAAVGMTIDNGNHLLLSGNRAALDYLREVGAADRLIGPPAAEFQFIDLASRQRWTLRFNDGRVPWWIFDPARRVPGTQARDYLGLAAIAVAAGRQDGRRGHRLQRCALFAAGRAVAARRAQYRSAARFGEARIRRDPRNARRRRPRLPAAPRPRRLERDADRAGACLAATARRARAVSSISFARSASARIASRRSISAATPIALAGDDAVILAVPPYAAASLLRGLKAPTEFRAIVNAHFRVAPPPDQPPILGVLNGTVEWIFAFPGRLSVTISAGDRLVDTPREELAKTIWAEVASVTGLAERASCRLGRSCASAAPLSPQRRRKT